jgi:hypothetical protein
MDDLDSEDQKGKHKYRVRPEDPVPPKEDDIRHGFARVTADLSEEELELIQTMADYVRKLGGLLWCCLFFFLGAFWWWLTLRPELLLLLMIAAGNDS